MYVQCENEERTKDKVGTRETKYVCMCERERNLERERERKKDRDR